MDLFKAIFADSSADESKASEGEENVETERSSIQVSENKTAEEGESSGVDARPELSNMADRVHSNHKGGEEERKACPVQNLTEKSKTQLKPNI